MFTSFLCLGIIAVMVPITVMLIKMHRIGKPELSVIPKMTGSFIIVWFGVLAYVRNGENPLASFLVWFLIVCLISDFIIDVNFIGGMASFALAHTSLIIWSLRAAPFSWESIVIWGAILIVLAVFFRRHLKAMGRLAIIFVAYAGLLAADFAIPAMLAVRLGSAYIPLAAGGLMFIVSDTVILLERTKPKPWHKPVVMSLYWGSLFLIALTPWLAA